MIKTSHFAKEVIAALDPVWNQHGGKITKNALPEHLDELYGSVMTQPRDHDAVRFQKRFAFAHSRTLFGELVDLDEPGVVGVYPHAVVLEAVDPDLGHVAFR
jgi:hypothetical protein